MIPTPDQTHRQYLRDWKHNLPDGPGFQLGGFHNNLFLVFDDDVLYLRHAGNGLNVLQRILNSVGAFSSCHQPVEKFRDQQERVKRFDGQTQGRGQVGRQPR
jgi:hypothetical protein